MNTVRFIDSVLGKVHNAIVRDKELNVKIKRNLGDIKMSMALLKADAEKYLTMNEQEAIPTEWILQVDDLACDIEDFVDTLGLGTARFVARLVGQLTVTDNRPDHVHLLWAFKGRIDRIMKRIPQSSTVTETGGDAVPSSPAARSYTREADLVGIEGPKGKLLELLNGVEDQPEQLKVISIVGFDGLGKTSLARAVYECAHFGQNRQLFNCRAWVPDVHASPAVTNDAGSLLREILQQVCPHINRTTTDLELRSGLQTYLQNKRYLIVIDDMQEAEVWKQIKSAFPENNNRSRIIVTTSIQSVATACSVWRYVYSMQCLEDDHSKLVFWKKVYYDRELDNAADLEREIPPWLKESTTSIFRKCDGSPLALVSIAQYLRHLRLRRPDHQLTKDECEVCVPGKYLTYPIERSNGQMAAFDEMRRVLFQCYRSLPDHDHRSCFLSLSIFPVGHPFKRKRLLRRWSAERLVIGDGSGISKETIARTTFKEFINRSIIQPLDSSNKLEVKKCRIYGMILEFIVHMSKSQNLIALIDQGKPIYNNATGSSIRRLCVHDTTVQNINDAIEEIGSESLKHVRSLTIHNSDIFDYKDWKLLRVLDLESCEGISNDILGRICKLVYLRYLSLRGTCIHEFPTNIAGLRNLETLDLRETGVNILPVEAIMLPQLAHLFGKFELPPELRGWNNTKCQEFLENNSRLQTLAGFVIGRKPDKNPSFQNILLHAGKLKKVKMWCKTDLRRKHIDILVSSLCQRLVRTDALESLSIDFSDISIDFLDSLSPSSCFLSSLKLCGRLQTLPNFIISLNDLNELHISSTRLGSEALSVLQSLRRLRYLKLVEDSSNSFNGNFRVRSDGFPYLQVLCFKAPKLPQLQIEENAMPFLTSLQLLCPDVDGLVVAAITHLKKLDEVILHSDVTLDTMQAWETAARQHIKRPSIKR